MCSQYPPPPTRNGLAPACADDRAGCDAPASAMFRRRWTSASVTDSEDLCCAGGIFTWHVVHFQVDVFVFLGFKGGLGVMERSDDVERSPSVVI